MKVILHLKSTEVLMTGNLDCLSDEYFPLALLEPDKPKSTGNSPPEPPQPRQQT